MATRDRSRKSSPTGHELALHGSLTLSAGGMPLGGENRIALLRAIGEQGSITQAAKAVGLSYKAAWDAVDQMNNLAGAPLVERSTGGRGGGSTLLTERGRQLVERFAQIEALHRRFVRQLSDEGADLSRDFQLLRMINMKTSARNQFVGQVCAYQAGAVNDEVSLSLPGGARIVAIVTRESTEQLGLKLGAEAFALVKASSVLIATGLDETPGVRLSARNQLHGQVLAVTPGAVNAEVLLDIGGGQSLAATITQASLQALDLRPGQAATALFKASSVILGSLV
ncbi:TOBE domain-containing protein [Roseateles sp. DAIF2]|uniref:TOBE domain-containing protein n=1 Tax=Roseateles sp. DAIF2 TaxID=2714952 RepID=UPI0018A32C63|nr:TOBE domain-containing protein [Roseateles sp. DAIF2]QPF74784.1 TOBE domain-containing protein [Roseateles sp. DAIF2]